MTVEKRTSDSLTSSGTTTHMSAAAEEAHTRPRYLSRGKFLLLAMASGTAIANGYYVHPIIADVAQDFGISATMIGLVPALNQIALALGIFLLLPLGDWLSNRRLVSVVVVGQFLAITLMAFSRDYRLFVVGSTILGFFTIAPYLLPAYVSKRVDPAKLGQITATLAVGTMSGILIARAGAGIVAEHFGWRTVYYIGASLMLVLSFLLPLIMEERESGHNQQHEQSYFGLLLSLAPIVRGFPEVLLSGAIQALSFGIFLSIWLGIGLHVTSPQMGYGVDVVGYLAAFSVLNLLTTPYLGKLADRIGARQTRVFFAVLLVLGELLFFFLGHNLWLLMIPIIITNVAGPIMDISGRMMFLSEAPEIRTRLMTVYIVMMFVGGGMSSWAGTAAYDWGGWHANAGLALIMSLVVLALAMWSLRRGKVVG